MGGFVPKHATYLAEKYPDDDEVEEEEINWLQNIEDELEKSEKICDMYMKNSQDKANSQTETTSAEMKKAARICKYEENNLVGVIGSLKIACAEEEVTVQTIKGAQDELKTQLE